MFHGMERGELRTLYVIGENPAQSEADITQTRKLLSELDFLVVQDIVLTRTAEMADVVFPSAASWCETDGTVTNSERRVQRVRKALDPPGEARDDMWIIAELARRLGHDWPEPVAEEVWDELRSLSPMHAGMSYARLEEHGGLQWPCPDESHPGLADPARAPVGRSRSSARPRRSRSSRPAARSRRSTPSTRSGSRPAGGSSRTTRARRRTSTARRSTAASRSTSRRRTPSGSSSPTARSCASPRGAARSRRRCGSTRRCGPGLAFMTFHFPDQVDTNQLTIDATDPKSGTAEFKAAAIRVEKLDPAEREERAGVAEPATVGGQE